MTKTSLKIVREINGDCSVTVTFSKKDFERHDTHTVFMELLRDASDKDFYNFLPDKPKEVK